MLSCITRIQIASPHASEFPQQHALNRQSLFQSSLSLNQVSQQTLTTNTSQNSISKPHTHPTTTMDYAQKRLDYEQTDRLSTMTEAEKQALRERRLHNLQSLIERADAVLAGNQHLLEKSKSERTSAMTVESLRERKKAREVRGMMERADAAFEVFRASATGSGQ